MPLSRRLALAALLAAAVAGPASAEPVTLRFVQTNDLDRMEARDGRGGVARLAAVLKAQKAKGPAFLVHSGDAISPSLLSGIDRGRHMIDLLNRLAPTAMVPGNHEFDFGAEVFRERMGEATFDILASNIFEPDGARPAGTIERKIVEVSGLKIGFFGLTTEDTPVVASPGPIRFAPSLETARAQAAALREAGADFVVAVVHTPLAVDMLLVRERLADLVLSGHDEHLLTYFDGRTALTESYSQADYVVVTAVTIDKTVKDGRPHVAWRPDFEVVDTAGVVPDPEMAARVKAYADRLDAELGVEIGTLETPLDSRRATVRGGEAAIGNLIADAMRSAVGADVAIINGGGIRADREYAAGQRLARRDVLAELPFGNRTVKIEVTGAAIRAALENGFSLARQGAGRFPQVSGMKVMADLGRLPGSRVLEVEIGGAPLDDARRYTVATNDYMATGGDGYKSFLGAKVLTSATDAGLMATQVMDYIAARGRIAPAVEGRIKLR